MAGSTDHYNLSQLGAGDNFSDDGYKYTNADRRTIDNLLHLGAEAHHHTGDTGTLIEPTGGPTLALSSSGGTIPAGTRVFYKYTLVNSRGEESVGSAETFVDTPIPITEPSAPVLSYTATGGILQAGNYYYVLTSYVGGSIAESKALHPSYVSIPANTATNKITITFPAPSGGQTGFNVYRRAPGQAKYYHLATVPNGSPTFIDDGTVEDDCDRTIPKSNTTNSTNSITVSVPGATPAVPEGYTWKIYRTYISGAWDSSFLTHVVENVSEGSDVITPTFVDIGNSTSAGSFPLTSMVVGSPSKIMLTDMEEVQGSLPMSASSFPFQMTFTYAGPLAVMQGSAPWVCEFPEAEIVSVRATLGRGSVPTATDVVVDINHAVEGPTPSFSTIFTNQALRPVVAVGEMHGERTTPNTVDISRGDLLTMDIDQIGGGATPTDRDLVVTVYMIVHGYSDESYVPGSSGGVGGSF